MTSSIPGHLELILHPDDLKTLLRQPELRSTGARPRSTAARGSKLSLIWHDTPDSALAADGLSIAEMHGQGSPTSWRLERMVPDSSDMSPPGAAASLIHESAALPDDLPQPLIPYAAFEGRIRALLLPSDALGVSLLQGELRAVAATHPVCRLIITGTSAFALAQHWAGLFRLSAPPMSLAAEAHALARGTAPIRPLGAPVLVPDCSTSEGAAFLVAHLSGVILHHAQRAALGNGPEPVHQMRVGLRRLRSAMKLFHRPMACPEMEAAVERLRVLGRVLGPPRDWDVFIAGTGRAVSRAFAEDAAVTALLASAERKRRASYAALASYFASPDWRQLGISLAELALSQPWLRHHDPDPDQQARQRDLQAMPLHDFATRVLQRRYDAVIEPGSDLSGLAVEQLHEIRLHAKRLRYAAEFFAPLFPGGATRRFLRRMSELQERLGALNDGAVARTLVRELPGRSAAQNYAIGVVSGYVEAGNRSSRQKIHETWRDFLKQHIFW